MLKTSYPQRIRFTGPRQVDLEAFEPTEPGPGEVRVRVLYSLLSTGTEATVFARAFDAGTHWDSWVKYPFYPGYALIGEIESLGDAVQDRHMGQLVAIRHGHCSEATVSADQTHPLPDGIDPTQAAWFALGKIASHGALAAEHRIGQSVAIVGAGPLGQMATRWAAASGVESLVVIDPVPSRLALAQAGGATDTINKPVGEAKQPLWDLCPGGEGPDVVIDVTGHPAVFAPALGLPKRMGRLVLLGDVGRPAQQHLTPDVLMRGIRIFGAHDTHEDCWDGPRAIRAFFKLVANGRINLDGLVTHTFRPDQVVDAFELVAERRSETMGVLFDWTQDGH